MLQRLEFADGLAELHARLEVFTGEFENLLHGAEGFCHSAQRGAVSGFFQHVEGVLGVNQLFRSDILEFDVGSAGAVDEAVFAQLHARCFAVDQEQGESAVHGRGDDQLVCRRRVHHQCLGAVDGEARSRSLGRGGLHGLQVETRAGFGVRQGDQELALGDGREQGFTVRFRTGAVNDTSAKHGVDGIRFHHQSATELLEDDGSFDKGESESAGIFREAHADPAEFAELLPVCAAESFRGVQQIAAALELVVFPDKALDTVAQHLLFIIEIEIHVVPASCFQYRRVYIE